MKAFEKKAKATQPAMPAKSGMFGQSHFGQSHELHPILSLQRTLGNKATQRLLEANQPPRFQSASLVAAKGETLGDEESFRPLKGEPEAGTEVVPASKGAGKKTVKKTELGEPTAGECGAYSWKVRFSAYPYAQLIEHFIVDFVAARGRDLASSSDPVRRQLAGIW